MSLAYLFKNVYKPNEIENLTAVGRPFLGMVPKSMTGGFNMVHTWMYTRPAGTSTNFASSLQLQDQQSAGVQLTTQPSQKYSIFRLDAKQLAASMKGDVYAYVSSKKSEMSQRIEDVYDMIDIDLHGAGNGIFAQASAINSLTVSLTNASIMNRFYDTFRLVNATNFPVDGTAPTLGTWVGTVTGVDFQANTITVDNTVGLGATDYILLPGDGAGFSATNQYGNLIGMGAWVPIANPASNDNFLGTINRSNDIARLSGLRTAAGGLSAKDANQLNLASIYALSGGKGPDTSLWNPQDWQRVSIDLQSQVRYEDLKVGDVTFKVLTMAGPGGMPLRIIPDPHQQRGQVRNLTMDSWELTSVNELVELADDDGLVALRDSNADAFQVRVRSYPQLRCFDPHRNGVLTGI